MQLFLFKNCSRYCFASLTFGIPFYFFVSAEGSALFLRDIKLVLLLRQLAMDNNADVSTPTLLSISGDFFVDLLFGDDIEFTIYNI